MATFGQRLHQRRTERKLSQTQLAKSLGMHYTIIGKYEREEVNPTIDVVRNLAVQLDTTVAFLAGEDDLPTTLSDATMIKRFDEVQTLSKNDRDHLVFVMDAVLRDARVRKAFNDKSN